MQERGEQMKSLARTSYFLQRMHALHILLALIMILSCGCPVRLIGNYDSQIDKSATELQQEMPF